MLGGLRPHDVHRGADLEDVGEEVDGQQRHGQAPTCSVGITGSPRESWRALTGQLGAGGLVPGPDRVQVLAPDNLAVAHQRHQQRPVASVVDRRLADADDLGLGAALGVAAAQGVLAAPDRDLVLAALGDVDHRPVVAGPGDELVDEAAGGVTAAGDQRRADPVAVHRRRGEAGDRELVEVGGDDDPGPGGAELVELDPDLLGEEREVAGVQSYGAQPGAGDLDRRPHRRGHVVGVDEERRAAAQRLDLRGERVALRVVQQREAVGARARGRDPVALPGGQVGRGGEAGDVRRPGGGDRGLLVGAAGAHLDAGAAVGGPGHPRRRGRDRRVVVEDREQQRLEEDRLGEGRLDDHQRRVGEVHLALGVAPDVAREPVAGQPVEGGLVDDPALAQRGDHGVVEGELLERVEGPLHAGHDAVPATLGEPAGEQLEHRPPARGAGGQRRLDHRQLVVVGQQCGRHPAHPTVGARRLG